MNTLENCQQPPAPNFNNSFRCHDSKIESFIYSAGRITRARVFSHSKANICVVIKIECRCRRRCRRRRCCRRRCCCYFFGLIVKSAAHVALVLFSSLFSLPTSSKQNTHTSGRISSLLFFSFFDDDADESAPKIRDRLKKKKEEEKENNEVCSTYAACFHLRHSLS